MVIQHKERMLTAERIARLRIISYPDPVLRKVCAPAEATREQLQRVAEQMLRLMHAHRGVGLAGPQVGLPWRIFVWNPTGEPTDDQVFVNPRFTRLEGNVVAEEGCLSIEGVNVNVARAASADITAQLPDGTPIAMTAEDLVARIWQHELDHLNGRLILDYMTPAEEIANRRALKDLEARYRAEHKQSSTGRRRKK